jgi:hypothetical protein
MSGAGGSGHDDGLQIMVIDRRGRVSGFVELDDLLALCAAALGGLADRAASPPERPSGLASGGSDPGS